MTIKNTEYTKIFRAVDMSLGKLEDISKLENLPLALKEKIHLVIQDFKNYDLNVHLPKLVELKGDILTEDQAKQIIVEATGYTKWRADLDTDQEWKKSEYFARTYGVSVKEDEIVPYMFFRKTNSRDEVFLVTMLCLPNCAYVSYDTDRADGDLGGLVKNAELESKLAQHI